MRHARLTECQMVQTLREVGMAPVAEVDRGHGVSAQTTCNSG